MSNITKKALAHSLKKKLSEKELNKITIQEITSDCGVNRQTFYYHFKDIYDLLEWIYMNEIIEKLDGKNTFNTWQTGFSYIFEYILENQKFIRNTYYSTHQEYLFNFIYKQTDILLINVIEEQSKHLNISIEDKKFIADFYKYAFVGVVKQWLENGMKEDYHVIIERISDVMTGSFENAFERLKN